MTHDARLMSGIILITIPNDPVFPAHLLDEQGQGIVIHVVASVRVHLVWGFGSMNPPLGSEERRQTQTIRKESDAAAPFEFSILAVDDSPVYRKLVQQSLQQEQCTVLPKSLKPIAASLTSAGDWEGKNFC